MKNLIFLLSFSFSPYSCNHLYSKLKNFGINDLNKCDIVLEAYYGQATLFCFQKCNKIRICEFVYIFSDQCKLLSNLTILYQTASSDSIIYRKNSSQFVGLINYWPIYSSLTTDMIGNKDLYNPVNANFSSDRFGNINSAIYLNNGYYQVPSGVYFYGDFTFIA
jgi:hypothetical protein